MAYLTPRVGATVVGLCVGVPHLGIPIPLTGTVTTGAVSVTAGSLPEAKLGSDVMGTCPVCGPLTGKITTGKFTYIIENMPAAMIGSVVIFMNGSTGSVVSL